MALSWKDPTMVTYAYLIRTGPAPMPPGRTSSRYEYEMRQDQLETMAYKYADGECGDWLLRSRCSAVGTYLYGNGFRYITLH